MCIVFFKWTDDRFLVCHNRDEFFSRPTTNTEWWPNDNGDGNNNESKNNSDDGDEDYEILAPRDVVSGGTWFGFEKKTGRCAFLTNIRELNSTKYSSSRGEFVVNYLKSTKANLSALEYLRNEFGDGSEQATTTSTSKKEYAGFNLVIFSGHDLAYFSNRYPEDQDQKGPIALSMGTPYGLSNSVLQEPYAKVRKGLGIFQQVLSARTRRTLAGHSETEIDNCDNGNDEGDDDDDDDLMEGLEHLMQREEYCPGDPLPRTGEPGFPEATVKHRSSICVPNVNGYGTRTTIRFLLEQPVVVAAAAAVEEEEAGKGNHNDYLEKENEQQQQSPRTKQQLLRCVEKNWNTATLEWEKSLDLNCSISLQ